MTNKLLIPILTIGLFGLIIFTASKVSAQNQQNPSTPIIQKLAQRFGLKESDVQAVFDEVRQERQQQRELQFEERLNQAVKDGNITEAQKQAILTKHKEIAEKKIKNRENWQNLSVEQRRQLRQEERKELENWANQNGIDLKYLFGWFGRK